MQIGSGIIRNLFEPTSILHLCSFMNLKHLFFILIFSIHFTASAQESAVRSPAEDWNEALDREIREKADPEILEETFLRKPSARSSAQANWEALDLTVIPEWPGSEAELQQAFEYVRDIRPYVHPRQPDFPRRATWLYPRDGCYARAAHVARSLESQGRPRPGKVFAFGNLKAKPFLKPKSNIYWSYHVASAYRFQGQVYVIDAAIEAHRPLSLKDWLARFSKLTNVRVAVCDSYAYTPSSVCVGGSSRQDRRSLEHQVSFLPTEWNYILSLKMNPQKIAGDEPPWITRLTPVVPIRDWPQ